MDRTYYVRCVFLKKFHVRFSLLDIASYFPHRKRNEHIRMNLALNVMEEKEIEYLTEWPVVSQEALPSSSPHPPAKVPKKETENSDFDGYEAKTELAIWLRKRQRRRTDAKVSKNVKCEFNRLRRSPQAKEFLRFRLNELLSSSWKFNKSAEYFYVLSTFHDELRNFEEAKTAISESISILGLTAVNELSHSDFLGLHLGQSEKDALWLGEKIQLSLDASDKKVQLSDNFAVERITGNDLTTEKFKSDYLNQNRRRPVIITGQVESRIDCELIRKLAGSKSVKLKWRDEDSTEWAKLEDFPGGETKVERFLDKWEANEADSGYLFDWSLPLFCPELAEKVPAPKYFRGDYLKRTRPGSLYRDSWPSLFVAPKDAVSDLHVDAFDSHFWMILFEGEKEWTFFHPDSLPLLNPVYDSSLDPVFNYTDDDDDNGASLNPVKVVLKPGEILFVPRGTPHRVRNLSKSIAISGNYVDETNVKEVAQHLRRNSLLDPRAEDLLQQFVLNKWL